MKSTYNKAAVKQYILDAIDFEGYEITATTEAEKLAALDATFRSEYGYMIDRVGYQEAMREWISGLPSCFNIEFRNHAIIELGVKWNSIPADYTEGQAAKIINNFFHFIAAKTTMMIRKAVN
jgi:hypothetical protein